MKCHLHVYSSKITLHHDYSIIFYVLQPSGRQAFGTKSLSHSVILGPSGHHRYALCEKMDVEDLSCLKLSDVTQMEASRGDSWGEVWCCGSSNTLTLALNYTEIIFGARQIFLGEKWQLVVVTPRDIPASYFLEISPT